MNNQVNPAEIRARYPEQKPVCFNYAAGRREVFTLLDLIQQLQEQRDYYKELAARNADKALDADKRFADYLALRGQIPGSVSIATEQLMREMGCMALLRQLSAIENRG